MSAREPMLETKELEAPTADVVPAVAVVVDEKINSTIEAKAVSLRRAATALLFFSLVLLCRARCSRCLSALVAIFALVAVIMLGVSIHAGMPGRIGTKVHDTCNDMPAEVFAWGQATISEHKCMRKGLAFLSRHAPDSTIESTMPTLAIRMADENATHHLVATADHETELLAWSQPEACDKLGHVAALVAKMMFIGSALAHLLLLFSAVAVVKRACRLRCAAYKGGLLKWSKCGGCKTACKPPAARVTPAATKELA